MKRKLAVILAMVLTLNFTGVEAYAGEVVSDTEIMQQSEDAWVTEAQKTGNENTVPDTEAQKTVDENAEPDTETQKSEAENTESDTETQKSEAENAGADTEAQKSEAENAGADTEAQKTENEHAEPDTETQKSEAEHAEPDTETQKSEAENAESDTETQKPEAENAGADTEAQKSEAEDAEPDTEAQESVDEDFVESLPEDPEYLKWMLPSYGIQSIAEMQMFAGEGYIHNDRFAGCTIRKGIDVSYYQGDIDWNAVKASGVEFAFVRVGYRGYGNGGTAGDPKAGENLRGAAAAGLKVGAYFFSQAVTIEEAVEEARAVMFQVQDTEITMPLVIDYEYAYYSDGRPGRLAAAQLSSEQHTAIVNAFCETVEAAGYEGMVYANKNMLESSMHAGNIPHKIWLAHYTTQTSYAGDYDYWQYTSSGSVDGINGRVDCNFWYDGGTYTQTIADGIYSIETVLDSRYAMDIAWASSGDGANLQLGAKDSGSSQDFKVRYLGNGKYALMAMCSGKYLDVENGNRYDGANILQYSWNNGENQKWYIQDAGGGEYYIRSAVSGKCIDVSGGTAGDGVNLQLWTMSGGTGQRFKFNPVSYGRTLEDGLYEIAAEGNDGLVFDVAGASKDNSANVDLWERLDAANQKFRVKHIGGGVYQISARHSDKLLDAQNGGTTPGTNVIQYEQNNGANQNWYLKETGNGCYNIISGNSGLYLEIAGDSISRGSNIQLGEGNGQTNQRFHFKKVETTTNEIVDGVKQGWFIENGETYWYDSGVMARDKQVYDPDSGNWYWFDADGTMAKDKDVFIPENAERTKGKWVRYDAKGGMIKGEDYRYGGWYSFDLITGEMMKGFRNIPEAGNPDGKWVYYDVINGQMHHGESCIDGNWYYFDDWTGKMVHGEYNRNGNWYYYDQITGIMAHGWTTLPDGRRVYYDEITGIMRQ